MTIIKQAIDHYHYGVTHDIFSEPVTSYAELAIGALEKQIPKKVINKGHLYAYACFCPVCNSIVSSAPPYDEANYCYKCGQALDWSEL